MSFFLLISNIGYSQDLGIISDSILNEGLKLYKLEKMAWISSDKLNEDSLNKNSINNFVTFFEGDSIKTIFYYEDSFDIRIRFIGKINSNDSLINENLSFMKSDRKPLKKESLYIAIKSECIKMINSSPNLARNANLFNYNISILEKDILFDIYLLPGTYSDEFFYLGSDYIIKFSKNTEFLDIIPQHSSLIEVRPPENVKVFASTHTHIEGFSPYITATDICQAKLYGELTVKCNLFEVVSENYLSTYDTKTDSLTITLRK